MKIKRKHLLMNKQSCMKLKKLMNRQNYFKNEKLINKQKEFLNSKLLKNISKLRKLIKQLKSSNNKGLDWSNNNKKN